MTRAIRFVGLSMSGLLAAAALGDRQRSA